MTSGAEIPDHAIRDAAREQIAIELGFASFADMQATIDPPRWLRARLERERRAVLREIGAASVEEARAAIAEARTLRARLDDANAALTHILTDLLAPLSSGEQDAACEAGGNEPLGVFRALKALFWSPKK